MAQKRKMETTSVVDENDRGLHSMFPNIATDISHLYTLAINHHIHKLAFDAGHKHALEKLNEWIALELQEGKLVTVADISTYLQKELNNNSAVTWQLQEAWGSESHDSEMQPEPEPEPGLVQSQETNGNALDEMEMTFQDRNQS